MGLNLSTVITSPQVIAAGGLLGGVVTVTPPGAGNFYVLMEQYTAELILIPGSRAYLHQVGAAAFVNSTTLFTTLVRVAAGVAEDITVSLTVPNTDCYLYLFLKQRTASVVAGAFVVGTTYEIMSVGTTDFTLIGATANTVGLSFVATGVGAGTGTAAELPDPDTDTSVDYVVVTLQSSAETTIGIGIDMSELMNLMITMMIVGMMMKMMAGIAK